MRPSLFPLPLAVFFFFLLSGCGDDDEHHDHDHPPPPMPAGTQQYGTPYDDTGRGIALDVRGNIYITGSTGGSLDRNTSRGLLDAFLTKFDFSRRRLGSKQFGTPGDDIAYAIAIDSIGSIYITGSTGGSLPGSTSSGNKDIFLVKVDPSANTVFAKQFGTNQDDIAYAISIDIVGNIYITGSTGGDLGTGSAGGLDIFLMKFDPSGNRIFTQQFGTNQDDIGYGLAVDNSGNIYITGSTEGILASRSFGTSDIFLAKFNSSGVNQFIVQFGSDRDDIGCAIGLSGPDNIYITGSTAGSLPGNTSSGLTDAFLAKFNSSGVNQFLHQFGTTGRDVGNSLAADAGGNIYAVGSTEGGLLGNTPFGLSDIFLVKFNSAVVLQFARQLGTSGNDSGNALAIQGSDIYITGSTEGNLDGNTSFGQADIFLAKYDISGEKK